MLIEGGLHMRLMRDIKSINNRIKKIATWLAVFNLATFMVIAVVGHISSWCNDRITVSSVLRSIGIGMLPGGIVLSIIFLILFSFLKKEKPSFVEGLLIAISGPILTFILMGIFATNKISLYSCFLFMLFAVLYAYLYGMKVVLSILSKKYAVNREAVLK